MSITKERKSNGVLIAIAITFVAVVVFAFLISESFLNNNVHRSTTLGNRQEQYSGASGTGTFIQTADKGFAIVGTSTDLNLMLIRTNETLTEQWRRTYGAGFGNAVAQTAEGGFVLAGAKTNIAESGTQNVSWLIKTGSEGNMLWSKEYQGNGFTRVLNVSDGGYVMLGRFNVTGTEQPGLLKVDTAGNLQWIKTYTSSEAEMLALYTLVSTNDGGYAMAGELRYIISGITMQNGWFVKTDANGDLQINRPFAMEGYTVLYSVVQANDGHYMLVGATRNAPSSPYSACVIYTDSDGHSQWSQVNATLRDRAMPVKSDGFQYYSVVKKTNGNFVILGYLDEAGIVALSIKGDSTMTQLEISGGNIITNKINYMIPVIQGEYAYVGYRDGTIQATEKYVQITEG